MATNEPNYSYATVESGQGGSPNNTLVEIASLEKKDKMVLIELNPYLLSVSTIKGGPKGTKIHYKTPNGEKKYYSIVPNSYDTKQTLLYISKQVGVTVEHLIKNNKDTLAEYCCFNGQEQVLIAIDSMTDELDSFTAIPYTVEKDGETLETIAEKYKDNKSIATKVDAKTLRSLNPTAQNEDLEKGTIVLIAVYVPGTGNKVSITGFGIQADTTRTWYVIWEWDHETNPTDHYEIIWKYKDSSGKWWEGSKTTTSDAETKEHLYNADDKAMEVSVSIKPIPTILGSFASDKYEWSTEKKGFNYHLLSTPSKPNVEIKKRKLTANLVYAQYDEENPEKYVIEFQVIQDNKTIYNDSKYVATHFPSLSGDVSYSCDIFDGHTYRVRCRAVNTGYGYNSPWSEWSDEVSSMPTAPSIYSVRPINETTISIHWSIVNSASSYVIEYIVKDIDKYKNASSTEDYFNKNPNLKQQTSVGLNDITLVEDYINQNEDANMVYIDNMATGAEYFIRVCAVNEDGTSSEYSEIKSFILGKVPTSPTTWSSTSSAVIGEPLRLYWMHNSEDGSYETTALVELKVGDYFIDKNGNRISGAFMVTKSQDEKERNEASFVEINTSSGAFSEGQEITWRVATAGVLSGQYGDWSISRTVDVYAPPVLNTVFKKEVDTIIDSDKITSLPLYIQLITSDSNNQVPTGYHVQIIADESYDTVDNVGNTKKVVEDSVIFSRYYDVSDRDVTVEIGAKDITLENNITYRIVCTVSMDSGLTAESARRFKVGWLGTFITPYADVMIDKETLSASIRPYVNNINANVLLSVYRREYDGSFTEIETDLPNSRNTFVTDPHPALDYARYRIIAVDQDTGSLSYNDIPGCVVGEKAAVIQWDEVWQAFDVSPDAESVERPWSGSMIKIPYNIDISHSNNQDVSLVKYIGRKRPVSYYATQLGETATWNMEIPKHDKETLHAIRRLSAWMGDVYVREPSGTGYWANIKVSYSKRHRELTIPITFNVVPVEGGK